MLFVDHIVVGIHHVDVFIEDVVDHVVAILHVGTDSAIHHVIVVVNHDVIVSHDAVDVGHITDVFFFIVAKEG